MAEAGVRTKGIVKWFNSGKGYGFITLVDTEDNRDVFVHYSAISKEGYKSLHEGDNVEFNLAQGPKGLMATDVIPAQEG